jgi:hypothetical protein
MEFQVGNLGDKHNIFLGFDWLKAHNPFINWQDETITFANCQEDCQVQKDSGETMVNYIRRVEDYKKTGFDQKWIGRQAMKQEALDKGEPQIPAEYQEFKDVFEKTEFDKLPERRPWDHEIKIKPGTMEDKKLKGKVYPISPRE